MQSLILGTAQWGSAYGITNQVGRLSDEALRDLVRVAHERRIEHLDTAPAYGDAEERIAPWAGEFAITTKVTGGSADPVQEQLRGSLARLGLSTVERCLVHDWSALDEDQRTVVVAALADAQAEGLVARVGVSAYTSDDLVVAQPFSTTLSVAQVPVNVLDQRLDDSSIVWKLRDSGWTIQARSVFLQGLLAGSTPTRLGEHPSLLSVARAAQAEGVSMMELSAQYVSSRRWVDEVVLGVTSGAELSQAVEVLRAAPNSNLDWPSLASSDLVLVDPRRW